MTFSPFDARQLTSLPHQLAGGWQAKNEGGLGGE